MLLLDFYGPFSLSHPLSLTLCLCLFLSLSVSSTKKVNFN